MKTSLGATVVLVFGLLLVVMNQQHASAQNNSNFDELLEDSGANLLQQDLDNEQAFMDCLDTKPANECWAWVLEDCTRLLTVEECEAIENPP